MKRITLLIFLFIPALAFAQVTGLELPYGIKVLDSLATDAWYGPYPSVDSANASVPEAVRKNRTVKVGPVEYWWNEGTDDEDLVVKVPDLTGEYWKTSSTTNTTGDLFIRTQSGETGSISISSSHSTGQGGSIGVNSSGVFLFDNSGEVDSEGILLIDADNIVHPTVPSGTNQVLMVDGSSNIGFVDGPWWPKEGTVNLTNNFTINTNGKAFNLDPKTGGSFHINPNFYSDVDFSAWLREFDVKTQNGDVISTEYSEHENQLALFGIEGVALGPGAFSNDVRLQVGYFNPIPPPFVGGPDTLADGDDFIEGMLFRLGAGTHPTRNYVFWDVAQEDTVSRVLGLTYADKLRWIDKSTLSSYWPLTGSASTTGDVDITSTNNIKIRSTVASAGAGFHLGKNGDVSLFSGGLATDFASADGGIKVTSPTVEVKGALQLDTVSSTEPVLIMPAGELLSTKQPGSIENDGDHLYYTDADSVRHQLASITQVMDSITNAIDTISSGSGGITNSAASNELMKSDGTDAVPSGLFQSSLGDLKMGSDLSGNARTIEAEGSSADVGLNLNAKGTGTIAIETEGLARIVSAGANELRTENTASSASSTAAKVSHILTSGTPAAGIGTGLSFWVQTGAAPFHQEEVATVEAVTTDVTTDSEDVNLLFKTMTNGTLTTKMTITPEGYIVIPLIPTTDPCATAPSGTLWSDSGALKVCP